MADDSYYDLSGRKVNSPTEGIYIHHGRKVVIKRMQKQKKNHMKKKYMVPTTVKIKASLPNLLGLSTSEDQDNVTAKQNNFDESWDEDNGVQNFKVWDADEY